MRNSRNKFGSRKKKDKPKMDGFEFDSTSELNRYCELKLLVRAGEIKDLEVHPKYILQKGIKNDHGQSIPQWVYTADYAYFDIKGGFKCCEDVKSLNYDKAGKKQGTATLRDYKLSRNEFMRQNPTVKFIEIYY